MTRNLCAIITRPDRLRPSIRHNRHSLSRQVENRAYHQRQAKDGREPSFVIPVFSEEVPIDGPTGKYRLWVTLQDGQVESLQSYRVNIKGSYLPRFFPPVSFPHRR